MSSLGHVEKRVLERVLGMGGGYVLNFNDRTFGEFFTDAIRLNIDAPKYRENNSGSKANRMRAFWRLEPDHVVGSLLNTMLDLAADLTPDDKDLPQARRIVERLRLSAPVVDLDAIEPNADGRDFEVLARSVRESIDDNEPEAGLDRLHTFVVRYVRVVADAEGIATGPDKPLHSLFGELIKKLKDRDAIESVMGERILKSTISTLEAFNDVRNNRSLAHDNQLLSYHEALLIFNHVSSAIRFLSSVVKPKPVTVPTGGEPDDDLPF